MHYFIALAIILSICSVAHATDDTLRFNDWYGIHNGAQKQIVCFAGSDSFTLTIYVDEQDITRLKFTPSLKIEHAEFDHRTYNGMNYNSLYGYDHWIRKMKKHYDLRIWFEGHERYEIFSLRGVSKAINWLYK